MQQQYDFAVIFDVDGTMVDNGPYHRAAWIEFGRRHGLPIDAAYYDSRIHSRGNAEITQRLKDDFGGHHEFPPVDEAKEAIYRELYGPHVRALPGFIELVSGLRDLGIPMAAASNSPRPNVTMVIGALGLGEAFESVVTASDGVRSKPAPDMFLRACQAMGTAPSRCVVFEDSRSGFAAARAAGMPYVAITQSATRECIELARSANHRAPSFTGMDAAWIQALLARPQG